uniref:Uncharacterized protein n=1 Tax=Anguilla anguilla TaxID=7936 RepID=A0A0E9WPR1_ANGAN
MISHHTGQQNFNPHLLPYNNMRTDTVPKYTVILLELIVIYSTEL